VKGYFAFDGDLVGRNAAFEEIGEFLNVLQLHEPEGILGGVERGDTDVLQTAVGDARALSAAA
jgi:hypothetical protein